MDDFRIPMVICFWHKKKERKQLRTVHLNMAQVDIWLIVRLELSMVLTNTWTCNAHGHIGIILLYKNFGQTFRICVCVWMRM